MSPDEIRRSWDDDDTPRSVFPEPLAERLTRENKELRAEVERLHALLSAHAEDAREDVAHWGGYASDYFAEKWHLDDDIAKWERRRNLNAAHAGEQPFPLCVGCRDGRHLQHKPHVDNIDRACACDLCTEEAA